MTFTNQVKTKLVMFELISLNQRHTKIVLRDILRILDVKSPFGLAAKKLKIFTNASCFFHDRIFTFNLVDVQHSPGSDNNDPVFRICMWTQAVVTRPAANVETPRCVWMDTLKYCFRDSQFTELFRCSLEVVGRWKMFPPSLVMTAHPLETYR